MPIGSGKADFGLVTAAGFELPWEVGVDVNAGLAAVGQSRPSGHILQPLASAVVTRELGGGLVPFAEAFFSSRE